MARSDGGDQQPRQPFQVERGTREHEELIDLREIPECDFPESRDRFEPGKDPFDPRPRRLTLGIPGMASRARIDRTAARALEILTDVWGEAEVATDCREVPRVEVLVGADGAPAAARLGRWRSFLSLATSTQSGLDRDMMDLIYEEPYGPEDLVETWQEELANAGLSTTTAGGREFLRRVRVEAEAAQFLGAVRSTRRHLQFGIGPMETRLTGEELGDEMDELVFGAGFGPASVTGFARSLVKRWMPIVCHASALGQTH